MNRRDFLRFLTLAPICVPAAALAATESAAAPLDMRQVFVSISRMQSTTALIPAGMFARHIKTKRYLPKELRALR